MKDTDRTFMVTDMCMWEKNKLEGKTDPHAIGVVDVETGENRYIRGGSKIKFIEGEISEVQKQEDYNNI